VRVVAGEAAHRIHALPEREGDDLRRLANRPVQDPCTEASGLRPVVVDAGPAHVFDVLGGIVRENDAAPDPCDHDSFLSCAALDHALHLMTRPRSDQLDRWYADKGLVRRIRDTEDRRLVLVEVAREQVAGPTRRATKR
jgi:hypothetical protein